MHAISRVMEFKVRSHLMGIETFDKSMQAYLLLEAPAGYSAGHEPQYANEKYYKVLGLTNLASNDEINKAHKKLCRTFHPDTTSNEDAKAECERHLSEINEAYGEIKKERGL